MSRKRGPKDPVLWSDVGAPDGVAPLDDTKVVKRDNSRVRSVNGGKGDVTVVGTDMATTEIDFGSTPVYETTFTVTDANITSDMYIVPRLMYVAPTGKDLDELEFAELDLMAAAGTGQFTLYARSDNGPVADKFKVAYTYGT